MTFSFTITRKLLLGDAKVIYGTFSNDNGSSGGAIETGLRIVENFAITYVKSSVIADIPTVNASLTTVGGKKVIETSAPPTGNITIVTTANESGFWFAIGT